MADFQLTTPVAFLIFNRPDTTARVFEAIRQAKPPKLLVVADGPRPDRPDDIEKCKAARDIIDGVDWDCEVLTNYSDANLGCKKRVSSGLDWVFDEVERTIILEDDCLPCQSFFRFCNELLEKYADDKRIMHIGGNNFLCARQVLEYPYYFSAYGQVWGWATWKRAWKHYDVDMKLWPILKKEKSLYEVFISPQEKARRQKIWDATYTQKLHDTWDYQWFFTLRCQNGLAILPKNNLITNIGFGEHGTHTKKVDYSRAMLQSLEIEFPLIHPSFIIRDAIADYNYELLNNSNLVHKISRKIKSLNTVIINKLCIKK
jgi:hypothetical protein